MFKRDLSIGEFHAFSLIVREAFSSLGVHLLLPYCLKQFGHVSLDPYHPAYARLVYNYEREWAWAVRNAFAGVVGLAGRVFVQPADVLDFLDRVCTGLPNVTVHTLFRGSPVRLVDLRVVSRPNGPSIGLE